jgi:uncharacterized protein (TIGR02600 family)
MKTISSRFPRAKRGMALISVLAVLLLLTLLVVAFLARTTSARTASSSYHATSSTRLLADMAVNIVQAQINEATTVGLSATGAPASGAAPAYTWGSQPGAIRVFVNNIQTPLTGSLAYVYRLYSAVPVQTATNTPRLINVTTSVDPSATTAAYAAMNADLPSDASWSTYGAQWCDLNAFTQDSQGRYHFPIVDPRDPAADPTINPTQVIILTGTAVGTGSLWHPTGSNPPLRGFSVQPPAAIENPTNPVNPAPMPVRWLYVLKDGSIIAPDPVAAPAKGSNALTFANAVNYAGAPDVPSVANPIVGRIAFWTDDDSSKININTAAGDDIQRTNPLTQTPNQYAADSIYWATPMFSGQDDITMAQYQPSSGEIQRYPGHPGTVGLNYTLSVLAGLATPLSYSDFYSLLPRYTGGGSQSSTVYVPYQGANGPHIPLTANRLYTSIGEMLFTASRLHSALVTEDGGSASTGSAGTAAASAVERAAFFLTAHSSSSELNLFGEPRVSIWPITTARTFSQGGSSWTITAAQSQTPIDQLIAFDSTVQRTSGGSANLFYFQRTDPTSSVTDCNIPNNIKLFNYLDTLTHASIPGFGYSFSTKYAGNAVNTSSRQILSEIRCSSRLPPIKRPLMLMGKIGACGTHHPSWVLTLV